MSHAISTEFALWSVVVLPGVAGGGLAIARGAIDRVAAPVSLAVAALVTAASAVAAASKPAVSVPFMAGSTLGLEVDALSAIVVPAVAGVTLLVLVFSAGEGRLARARFHGLMLLFASAVMLTATATTLPALLMAWEVMGATSYALIGFWWRDDHRVTSGTIAFITTRTADLGLYVAAGAALAGGAGLAIADLPGASSGWRDVVAVGVLVAALGKAAQLPFAFWLSRAMDGPSPVSALLHSAAMVAMGGYLLLRVAPLLATGWAATAAAWVGGLTALILGLVAVSQRDLKQLLAASTAAQLGFVVLAAGVSAVSGGATHLVAHAATKALLFLVAGAWLTALGTKRLAALRGAARLWSVVGASAAAGALALAGVAPLSLWATKDAILAGALEHSLGLYVLGLAATALSAAYAGKILLVMWRPLPDSTETGYDEEQQGTRDVNALQRAPLVALAIGALTLGVLALPPLGDLVREALGEQVAPSPTPLEATISTVLVLAVLAVVVRYRLPEPRWARAWLGLEAAAYAIIVRPVMRLAAGLGRFDDAVLDRSVEAVAPAALNAARRAGFVDDRGVDGLVESLAARVRRLGQLARRPQTGLLHQYYIQAIAMLALGVLLVVVVT